MLWAIELRVRPDVGLESNIAGIVTVLVAPLQAALVVLVPLGVALNGTSSVLYGTVADLVSAEGRSRSYGLYYTLTIGASALSPTLYGALSDVVGVPATLTVVSAMVLVTIPLCIALRPAVSAPPAGARA
jgi:MFS family permease